MDKDKKKHKSGHRQTFAPDELAICLSHYDLGIIKKITDFPRGSKRAPKCVVESERGKYLFKRRQRGVEDIRKVAFTHQIQLSLASQNFPLPHLQGTRDNGNSMLIHQDKIYELQEFIVGTGYDQSLKSTEQSGRALGLYHKLLEHFQGEYEPPTASYHNALAIHKTIIHSAKAIAEKGSNQPEQAKDTVNALQNYYRRCAEKLHQLGLDEWPAQIVHGDWHPGNMLFRDQHVAAVIDYDTARHHQRVIDFANGALQFSIIGGGKDPLHWPAELDVKRYRVFLRGYDSVNVITTGELKAIPLLMCEAMIAEAVLPIASTGAFGRFDGGDFLVMIRKKSEWILKNYKTLVNILNEEQSPVEPKEKLEQKLDENVSSHAHEDISVDDPLSGLAAAVEEADHDRHLHHN